MPSVFKFETSLDQPTIPLNIETELKVHLKIEPRAELAARAPATAKAMITNICLVFDCSGSMAGQKRETAIEAAKMIVDTVDERHRLSLVGFSTRARVLVDNAHPTREGKGAIKQKIDKQIRAFSRGTTNLSDGIKKAADVLDKTRADAKVMIILSDGGADSQKKAQTTGMLATNAGVQLFAVGIGDGYEADALLRLATPSNGAVFGETDLEKIKSTFEVLIGRIESFVATNALLAVTLDERVRAGTAYKTSPEQALIGKMEPDTKGQVKLHVGNIEQGKSYGFLLTVTAPARGAGKHVLARAALSYDAPSLGLRDQKVELEIQVEYAKGNQKPANAEVNAAFRGAQFVELAGGLADAQRRGDQRASAEILQQLIRHADGDQEARAFYEDLLEELNERGKISQQRINALVLGSTTMLRSKKKVPQLYEVVLIDAGATLIPFFRELRRLTGMDLRAIDDLVKRAPVRIQVLPLSDARALKKQLQGTGAQIEVKPRAEEERA